MQFKTIIECDVPRVSCADHGVKQLPVAWAEAMWHSTALFEALVINWLKESSISGVADLLDLSWDAVAGIQKRAVDRGLERRRRQLLKDSGIDETSFRKRHEYVTVILDRNRDIVLDVLDDRKAESLETWLRDRPAHHLDPVQTVTMDMWDPFIKAVKAANHDAEKKSCFDRYHVAQHFGKALDKVCAQEHRDILAAVGESPLKGTRYDWQRNSSQTDNRARRAFMSLSRLNLKAARAWSIKETAASLWNYSYRGSAEKVWCNLLGWIARCRLVHSLDIGYTLLSGHRLHFSNTHNCEYRAGTFEIIPSSLFRCQM
jgi:transposase